MPLAEPIHAVTISPFLCMRTPVTRRLYLEVMGADPGGSEGMADGRPVNNVSWFDAIAFCNRWSERAGLTPCYVIDGDNLTWDTTKDGYRLLTEAEWEYACRAGSEGHWCFDDEEEKLSNYAWFSANSNNQTQPVGQKRPNAWGLYDLHGNVWEWCWDWYNSYSGEPQADPTGPTQGQCRVLRGGAFDGGPWACARRTGTGSGPRTGATSSRPQAKATDSLETLITYLSDRRPYLPNYKQRRAQRPYIGSTHTEKANDLLAARHQKHRGMHWCEA